MANAVVIIDAVAAEINPPAKLPIPGINFKAFVTINLPAKVAPPVPPMALLLRQLFVYPSIFQI